MSHYELRDEPDDLPVIIRAPLSRVRAAARKRAARIGAEVLIYEVSYPEGEKYIGYEA